VQIERCVEVETTPSMHNGKSKRCQVLHYPSVASHSTLPVSSSLHYYGSTALCWALVAFFSFVIYAQSVGLLGRGDQSVATPLPTHTTTQTQNNAHRLHTLSGIRTQERTQVFERAKTVHALDRAATVNGTQQIHVAYWAFKIRISNV
jgi:hypothetical protein